MANPVDIVAKALANAGPPGMMREHGTLGVAGGSRPTPFAYETGRVAVAALVSDESLRQQMEEAVATAIHQRRWDNSTDLAGVAVAAVLKVLGAES